MSIQFPEVHAVIPVGGKLVGYVQKMHEAQFIEPAHVVALVEATQALHLARLDNPDHPYLEKENGKSMLYMVWGHPKNPLDPDYMVVLACPLGVDSHGDKMFKPDLMMRGPKANVVVVGGMSCCGAAVQTHVSYLDGETTLDIAGTPVGNLPHPEHSNWLKGRTHIVSDAEGLSSLKHLAIHVLAKSNPGNHALAHDCSHEASYTQYAKKVRAELKLS